MKKQLYSQQMSNYGDFSVSNPIILKDVKNLKYFQKLEDLQGKIYNKLFLKKKGLNIEIISNINFYMEPSWPTILEKKKQKKIFFYTQIYGRGFLEKNLKEKYIGKFEVKENRVFLYRTHHIDFLHLPEVIKHHKEWKIKNKKQFKKFFKPYLEVPLKNGKYDIYQISDKKPFVESRLALPEEQLESLMWSDGDTTLLRGFYLKLK